MIACHTDPLPAFIENAMPWLRREPVLHNVFLTVLEAKQLGRTPESGGDTWIRAVDEHGGVVGAAMYTPPRELLLGEVTEPVARAIAEFTAERMEPLTGAVANPAPNNPQQTRAARRRTDQAGAQLMRLVIPSSRPRSIRAGEPP